MDHVHDVFPHHFGKSIGILREIGVVLIHRQVVRNEVPIAEPHAEHVDAARRDDLSESERGGRLAHVVGAHYVRAKDQGIGVGAR